MRETITINRIIHCPVISKEIAQQISAYILTDEQTVKTSEILTKYCSGETVCQQTDCQFIAGITGTVHTHPLESIYACSRTYQR